MKNMFLLFQTTLFGRNKLMSIAVGPGLLGQRRAVIYATDNNAGWLKHHLARWSYRGSIPIMGCETHDFEAAPYK
jgi:hypothetical protein